jgi:Ala-tRNA(Pro) deacylase
MIEEFNKIKEKLDSAGIEYRTVEHGDQSEDSDRALGYDPADRPHHGGAKAIVIKGRKTKTYYHFVLPDDCRLAQKKVKEFIGERWSFAPGEEVKEVTHCIPGSVPPFGSCIGLQTHMDKRLTENEKIFFNAGSLTNSIEMNLKDYVAVEQPIEVEVTE